jgi:hypothetical protein
VEFAHIVETSLQNTSPSGGMDQSRPIDALQTVELTFVQEQFARELCFCRRG